jgi:urate oxidase
MTSIILGKNQYGKAENRVVRITRDTDRHEIEDLNVTSQLRGDFASAHFDGNNEPRRRHRHAEEHGLRLRQGRHRQPRGVPAPPGQALHRRVRLGDRRRWAAEQYTWLRIEGDNGEHDHAFVRGGTETRTAVVQIDGDDTTIIAACRTSRSSSPPRAASSATRRTSTRPSPRPRTASSPPR